MYVWLVIDVTNLHYEQYLKLRNKQKENAFENFKNISIANSLIFISGEKNLLVPKLSYSTGQWEFVKYLSLLQKINMLFMNTMRM